MRVLVVVASRHGSTLEIAQQIGRVLSSSGLQVDIRSASERPDTAACDAVVLGSAIYYGKWLPAALAFVRDHEAALERLPVWLFSVGALVPDRSDGNRPPSPHVAGLMTRTHARGHGEFRGKLAAEGLSWRERLMVSLVRVPYGDFRDWTEVRGWAHDLAAQLAAASAAPAPESRHHALRA